MAIMIKTDTDIQQDVLEELDWDPEIAATEVGVAVDDGVVTLAGTVDSYAKKMAAEQAAQRVDGVRAVANDLVVRSPRTHNDTDIAKAAADALEASSLVPREKIEVTVKNGKITLSGEVLWDYQRAAAARCLHELAGVRDVINLISVRPPHATAEAVKSGIERALVRNAEVDAAGIRVEVDGGHVRLTGTVRSWPEKREAVAAAWRAAGVTFVNDAIHVRPA